MRDTDIVFVSPGVPWRHPVFAQMRDERAPVSNAADWFMARHGARTVGITGTKGKSTTAAFLAHLLAGLGARGGRGQYRYPLSDLDPAGDEWVVAELSSQQCALLHTPPAVAVITNLFQDHLDFHGDIASYYEAKSHVFGAGTRCLASRHPLSSNHLRRIGISDFPRCASWIRPRSEHRRGTRCCPSAHNTVNAALAALAAEQVLGRR